MSVTMRDIRLCRWVAGFLVGFSLQVFLHAQSSAPEFVQLGTQLMNESPGLAIWSFTRAIKEDPTLAAAYLERAKALIELRNYDAAQTDIAKVIELEGESVPVLRLRADMEKRSRELRAAIATLTRAIEISPNDEACFRDRAELWERVGNLKEAECDYTWAIKQAPWDADGYHHRRAALRETLGDLDGALADYSEIVGKPGMNSLYVFEPAFRRGSILYGRQAYAQSVVDFRSALTRSRDHPDFSAGLHIWLARSRLGETAQADQEFSNLISKMGMEPHASSEQLKLAEFILGAISESEYWDYIGSTHRDDKFWRALASFYTGMKRLLDGDESGATDLLQIAASTEFEYFQLTECQWAKWELERLD